MKEFAGESPTAVQGPDRRLNRAAHEGVTRGATESTAFARIRAWIRARAAPEGEKLGRTPVASVKDRRRASIGRGGLRRVLQRHLWDASRIARRTDRGRCSRSRR
jgi:hypothetical protein